MLINEDLAGLTQFLIDSDSEYTIEDFLQLLLNKGIITLKEILIFYIKNK